MTSAGRPGREQALADAFVLLADTLVDDYDVADLLYRLVMTAVDVLAVSAAGLLPDDQRGNLAVVASTSEESHLLDMFQLQNEEGPCLECIRDSAAVVSSDLVTDTQRWPTFAPAALAAGFRSAVAVPLRRRDVTVGALNLFQSQPGALVPDDVRIAQALADVATIEILQQRAVQRSTALAEQLQRALDSRVVIEQAKGILAERHSLPIGAAFELLRRRARDSNRKLTELAQELVSSESSGAVASARD